jgi:hypothetical protein
LVRIAFLAFARSSIAGLCRFFSGGVVGALLTFALGAANCETSG